MRRDAAESPTRASEVGEQTAIPVGKNLALARMGAAAYLAVVAYPDRVEWGKRDDFIEAVKSFLLKGSISQGCPRRWVKEKYRSFPNRRIDQTLDKAFRIIVRSRLPAGMIANWLMMDGARFEVPLLAGKPAIPMVLRAPNSVSRGMKAVLELVKKRDNRRNLAEDAALSNLYHRVWKTSLPVLHLVVPITGRFRELSDPVKLVLDPSWVENSIRSSQWLWAYLPQRIPSFCPETAIQLSCNYTSS